MASSGGLRKAASAAPPNWTTVGPGAISLPWTDITYLLHKYGVSWRYYVFEGSEPDCEDDEAMTCAPVTQGPKTSGIWNPLVDFEDVKEDSQIGNVQSLTNFYTAVHDTSECALPNVSWITPNSKVSEHPPALVSTGQAYVTTTINSIMRSPCWGSTAIFLSWDDWGGFYDNVVPPVIDGEGYGFRVPGLVISPYAKAGYIDHQQLSHDAYLKFIEDDFMDGQLTASVVPRQDLRLNHGLIYLMVGLQHGLLAIRARTSEPDARPSPSRASPGANIPNGASDGRYRAHALAPQPQSRPPRTKRTPIGQGVNRGASHRSGRRAAELLVSVVLTWR